MTAAANGRCVIDLMLLSIAEYLEIQRDDEVVSQLEDMCAVSQLDFLERMEEEVIILPSDWRADILMKLMVFPTYNYEHEEETASGLLWEAIDVEKLANDVLDITGTISQHCEIIEVPFAGLAAVEYVELIGLLPQDDVTGDMDIEEYKLTCKYAALARSLNLPFKTNNFLFHDAVKKANPDDCAWVELIFDVYEGQK